MRKREKKKSRHFLLVSVVVLPTLLALGNDQPSDNSTNSPAKVSYHREIRPIFQAHCQGCHQPAKANGAYVMTAFDRLLKGGETGQPAVVAGRPDESYLIELITPENGEAQMPRGKKPLASSDIARIKLWITEGAVDDTPAGAEQKYDAEHPPVYSRPPVITSLDFAPAGNLLAISAFHEVLLVKADGSELVARLVGMSERIESVTFSPDGKLLAVAGGLPARMGEVQVWDVEKRKLKLSLPVTYDTVYGARWSPDGKMIAFGCADNSVRVIDAATGEQVLFQGAHSDWVRDTVFSADSSHLVSVGRDMTTKLTEVATQRFVDNVTSITPGALKGGIQTVARHPTRDEIVIGGSDGAPKIYRMHRIVKRRIGDDSNIIREFPALTGRIWSVAVSHDGTRIAAGSSLDGTGEVRVYEYPSDTSLPDEINKIMQKVLAAQTREEKAALRRYITADTRPLSQIEVSQSAVYSVAFRPDGQVLAAAGADGMVRLIDAETGRVVKEFSPAPIGTVSGAATDGKPRLVASTTHAPDFIRAVNPVLSRLGCNQGTCHGAAQGKNGFKLSLRGYDPLFDVRALTDDLASRRVNLASPEKSLMLLKPTGAVPHVGGQLLKPDDAYYQIIREWIAGGARLDLGVARVARIEVTPQNPVLETIDGKQQFRVTAIYEDGAKRDVTREAFIESGNTEVATAERGGLVTCIRRGETPVLARYEGQYAATTLTVMGDRSGFEWQDEATWGRIDELTAAKWRRMKIRPSDLCTDAEFIRRVTLDLTGLPPAVDEVRAFLADTRDARTKHNELIDKLIGSDPFVEHWTNKWADLLQVNRKFLDVEGAVAFRRWIHEQVAHNTPYDSFVRTILEASGSNRENPPASYYKILREPGLIAENTTQLFLGVRFNCNKCHDHPFERWTQDQYYQFAAFFAGVDLKPDPASGEKKIGGTAVDGAKPLYEIVADNPQGIIEHLRTGVATPPKFPYEVQLAVADATTRRDRLAEWVSARDNPYFARSFVNRLWGYLFGVGLMEPIDDIRAGNPPTNPELLDYLTQEFLAHDFDTRHMLRQIARSRTYQLSVETNPWNADDKINYSHALARRLPAEVLFDAVHRVTGAVSKLPGAKPGARAAELPDSGVDLPSGFFTTFGRPPRESACECERSNGMQLGPVMALVSGPTIAGAISDPGNELAKLVANERDDRKLIAEVFLRILNRPATDREINAALQALGRIDKDHSAVSAALSKREQYFKPIRVQQEREREAAILTARHELDTFEKELAPQFVQLEQEQAERSTRLEAELRAYETSLDPKLAASLEQKPTAIAWRPIVPKSLKASNGATLHVEPDGSISATEPKAGSVKYVITAETDLTDITGIRLEVLADDSLPGRGPGFSPNGNFVVTEFDVKAAAKAQSRQVKPVKLESPLADFSQAQMNIASAIDGDRAVNNGWAIAPQTGRTHWATFETSEPLGFDGGTVLTFMIEQKSADNTLAVGRFCISLTRAPKGFGLTYPGQVGAILALDPMARSPAQQAELLDFLRTRDDEYRNKRLLLADSKRPLPIDPKLVQLRERLETVSQPAPEDTLLVQLRHDVEQSSIQLSNKRLTAAQDLAWALINSPEFLFNH